MAKCSICSREYPHDILASMVQIVGRKAYLQLVCPACQPIVVNNPNYYYLAENPAK